MFERIKALFSIKERVFDCFTGEALAVVRIASDEARSMRHNFVGTEHILLGLIAENQGKAAQTLRAYNIDLASTRLEVAKIWGDSRQRAIGDLPFTPSAKRLIESALRQSKSTGVTYVGTEHLLLGIIEPGRGVAMKVLNNLGVTKEQIFESLRKT